MSKRAVASADNATSSIALYTPREKRTRKCIDSKSVTERGLSDSHTVSTGSERWSSACAFVKMKATKNRHGNVIARDSGRESLPSVIISNFIAHMISANDSRF